MAAAGGNLGESAASASAAARAGGAPAAAPPAAAAPAALRRLRSASARFLFTSTSVCTSFFAAQPYVSHTFAHLRVRVDFYSVFSV
jgi:hypothetical protein